MVCGVIPKFLYNGKELKHCVNSEFVGEINEPYEGFSKLMKIDNIPEKGSSVFKTRDLKGNIVTFWEKPEFGRKDNLEIADCFTFKGIVIQKFNSDWDNGLPVTCLNKVRLIKNYGKPKQFYKGYYMKLKVEMMNPSVKVEFEDYDVDDIG